MSKFTLLATLDVLACVIGASEGIGKRNKADVVCDRIRQASTEATLPGFMERLCALLNIGPGSLNSTKYKDFLLGCHDKSAADSVLQWIRRNPSTAIMLAITPADERSAAADSVELPQVDDLDDCAPSRGDYEVELMVTCLSALAHGGDENAGNAKLFRRQGVLGRCGKLMQLPFVSGNAVRGMIRDLLADHYLRAIGLEPSRAKPPVALWFFYALYSGGSLEEGSAQTKALQKELGDGGAAKAVALTMFRDMVPPLSVLGTALGNRCIERRCDVGDLRPCCKQWGTGTVDVAQLLDWSFLTRREDHEEHEEHHGMIATVETLKTGTVLLGGIDVSRHATDVERGCLAHGINLLIEQGRLGGENRRGLGQVRIEVSGAPGTPSIYLDYLAEHRAAILDYLNKIGALQCTPSN